MEKKKKNRKSILLALALLLVLTISVGYAAISSDILIKGTTTVKKNSWNVIISSITNINKSEGVTGNDPTASEAANTVSVSYTANLNKPGDFYEFEFTVKNGGTLPIKLSDAPSVSGSITDAEAKYFSHAVTETDGSEINVANSTIAAGATKTYKVRVEFKNVNSSSDLPSADNTKQMDITLNYTQA